MASVSITTVAQSVSLPPGTPVTFSTAGSSISVLIGYTSAGAATGPTVATVSTATPVNWTWPGVYFGNYGAVVLWVQCSSTTVTLSYPG